MSARRTSSVSSLSKYAKGQPTEEDLANRSTDFCNAFWGIADGGYDVLLTRIRGAARTTEELRAFWKERAAIEDDYAKRMAKLAKQSLGRDEIGELRSSIDTLRLETDRQATSHAKLAQIMRKELEEPVIDLLSKQSQFKRVSQSAIEKSFKAKQTQENYVKKARQKYEDDCVKINSYTAQATLVQGKDLDKVQLRLEKAKITVQTNEREFSQFARALADTTSRWEKEWKVFCDICQDLEEERIEFIKDNMWSYANAVSTVCVSDDESCEKLRVSLEQVESVKDIENFVRDYGTGPQIPDPPAFVDYNTLEAGQQPSRPTWRPANFARSSNRAVGIPLRPPTLPDDEPVTAGNAGIGAGGGRPENGAIRPPSEAAVRATPGPNGAQSAGPSSPARGISQGLPSSSTASTPIDQAPLRSAAATTLSQNAGAPQALPGSAPVFRAPHSQDPLAEPIDPRAETMLKVGSNAYPVDLSDDPQQGRMAPNVSASTNIGEQDDPLAKQMAALRDASGGSVRKGAPARRETHDAGAGGSASGSGSPGFTSTGSISQAGPKNYQAPADAIVGGPPPPVARATSPNPPTATFMNPPVVRSTSPLPVEDVVSNYQQSFPGERRSLSVSRQNSVNRGRDGNPNGHPASGSGSIQRPVSPAREGHVGIGAHGRSRSPSPQPPMVRSVSPGPASSHSQQQHQMNYHVPPPQQAPVHASSSLGIAIDETGRVARDTLVDRMYGQQQQQQQAERRPTNYYAGSNPVQAPPPQPAYDAYSASGSQSSLYSAQRQYSQQAAPPPQQPPPQPHQIPARTTAGSYFPQQQPQRQGASSSVYNPYSPSQAQPGRQPTAVSATHSPYVANQTPPSQSGFGYPQDASRQVRPTYGNYPQHAQQSSNGYQVSGRPGEYGSPHAYGQPQGYRATSPGIANRSPSPAAPVAPPTGQYTDDGEGVLFYVKALWDYEATIEEEFDFQAGDIIAVTATPEDGWWSGMLMDEMRRVPGKTIFPSNFVSLF